MNWFKRLLGGRRQAERPAISLRVEELESRWVPSSIHTSTSTNWSGYAVTATNTTSSTETFTAVSGSWTVPSMVTKGSSGTTYSSAWVGLDGFSSSTVEQTGTEMDVSNGVASYSAWYEIYPNAPVTIPMTVLAGDKISASVKYNGSGSFTLTLSDADGNQSYTTTQKLANPQLSSAEWIVEAPSSYRGPLPLANFGSVSFTNASATMVTTTGTTSSSTSGSINNSAWASAINQINMVNSHGATLDTTGSLSTDGTSFIVGFGTSVPSTPATFVSTTTSLKVTSTSVNSRTGAATVTFVATVTASSGTTLPTGTVEVLDGSTVLGTVTIQDVNGVAEAVFTVTFPPTTGNYDISVIFAGDNGFAGSVTTAILVSISSHPTKVTIS